MLDEWLLTLYLTLRCAHKEQVTPDNEIPSLAHHVLVSALQSWSGFTFHLSVARICSKAKKTPRRSPVSVQLPVSIHVD